MKSLTEYLWFNTPHRRDYINITDKIAALVQKKRRPGRAGIGGGDAHHRLGLYQ